MTKQDLINIAGDFFAATPLTKTSIETAAALDASDFAFFDAPLIGFAAADDPLFEKMKEPQIIGQHFVTPLQWMENAKSVVSIFVPFSDAVKSANNACPKGEVAPEYIYAKNEAVPFMEALADKLTDAVKAAGYSVVVPSREADRMKAAISAADGTKLKFTSGWSERHIAYICGMGTFGISGGLITEKGAAGRFISFITDMPLEADKRSYSSPYEYCTLCGACAAKCPAGAITAETGKDKAKCSAFVNSTKEKYAPLYGCARCQCGVPCAGGVPKKK